MTPPLEAVLWVARLLEGATSLPRVALRTIATTLCLSVAPNTLERYITVGKNVESRASCAFASLLPFSDDFMHSYVLTLLAAGLTASTVNSHVSAMGTLA